MPQFPAYTRREILIGAGAALSAPLSAETRQEKGRRLVEEALEALGGQAFVNLSNIVTTGRAYSFYNTNLRGLAVMTIYDRFEPMQENADRDWLPISRRELYTEKGDYYALFRNGKGWEVTYRGARPQPSEIMERYRLAARRDFFYFLRYRLNEAGLYFYFSGTEIVDNTPTDAVEITDAEGDSFTVYIRQSDHLPVSQVYLRRDPKTRIPYEERTVWSKFRPVESVVLPWNIRRERDGDKIFELFGRSFQINQQIDASLFELPGGITVLPEAP